MNDDGFLDDLAASPRCPDCVILLRDEPGGWRCPECGHWESVEAGPLNRPFDGPALPGS